MSNSKPPFATGDLVVVFGGEIDRESKSADLVSVCRVIIPGEKDLIVEHENARSYSSRISHHKVPQNICVKLSIDPDIVVKSRILEPQIGDLVLSFSKEDYKDEAPTELTGILYKISYKLGHPHKCALLCGTDLKEVNFDSLMVLQRN